MANIEAKIINGLLTHFGAISLPAGVTVAYPNINFDPDGSPYVRLTIAKNQPVNHHIGGGKEPERVGIFMAVVCWPVGAGIVAPSELAGTIRDHFKFNTQINYDGIRIWITEEPRVAGDDQGPVYCEIPVVIPWRCLP
ncbi:phage tail terminator-like protein [Methyloceanibacter caenitepidi]|uniref:Phage protein n=1 Tax=Methyloceanibacter caenitepidi TaxID=1384459 RepID=A0A0A8K5T5_9HYPH|nr:phage tail terminator-like protein [Methyloceanibacter caenitepidi]BAQ18308.1 hypothetical protein GL4_2875 [Methyloceanibacter caenitepidi]